MPRRQIGEAKMQFPSFFTLALEAGDQSAPHPRCLTLKDPQYPLNRRLGGPQN